MAQTDPFAGLKKLPETPAQALADAAEIEFSVPIEGEETTPADALRQFAEADKPGDQIRMLALALPPREGVWWACVCMRDMLPAAPVKMPDCLTTAEAWVYKPNAETREAAHKAAQAARPSDDTQIVATAAVYAAGTMGPGDLDAMPLQAGAFANVLAGAVLTAMANAREELAERMPGLVIERGLDIARGGNGRLETEAAAPA